MCRKLGPNCGYPQFRVIFAQKLGWCWVVGVNLPKLGSNYPNFTPISPPNCGKIGVKLVLWLGLGVVFHILIGLGLWLGVSKPHFAHPCSRNLLSWDVANGNMKTPSVCLIYFKPFQKHTTLHIIILKN